MSILRWGRQKGSAGLLTWGRNKRKGHGVRDQPPASWGARGWIHTGQTSCLQTQRSSCYRHSLGVWWVNAENMAHRLDDVCFTKNYAKMTLTKRPEVYLSDSAGEAEEQESEVRNRGGGTRFCTWDPVCPYRHTLPTSSQKSTKDCS